MYLHRTRIPITQNWFAQPGSFGKFAFCVGGGFIVGGLLGGLLFVDRDLLRLYKRHMEDKHKVIVGQKIDNFRAWISSKQTVMLRWLSQWLII